MHNTHMFRLKKLKGLQWAKLKLRINMAHGEPINMMNLFTRTFNTNHHGHKQTKYSLLLVGNEFNSDVALLIPWRINPR